MRARGGSSRRGRRDDGRRGGARRELGGHSDLGRHRRGATRVGFGWARRRRRSVNAPRRHRLGGLHARLRGPSADDHRRYPHDGDHARDDREGDHSSRPRRSGSAPRLRESEARAHRRGTGPSARCAGTTVGFRPAPTVASRQDRARPRDAGSGPARSERRQCAGKVGHITEALLRILLEAAKHDRLEPRRQVGSPRRERCGHRLQNQALIAKSFSLRATFA